MKSVAFTAFIRTQTRRGGVKKLRATGRIPAVIYGGKTQPQNLEFDQRAMKDLIHHSVSENLLLDLSIPGDARAKRLALVQDVHHHPLNGQILHVDLHEVAENEKVTITVPVETKGEAVGVKSSGGILEHVLFKIKVCALPKDLPEVIEVDVSNLEIGQSIHLGDIKAPEGVEIIGDKHISVIAVAAPLTEAAETAAAAPGAPAGEVEMIKEKKDEAGGEAKAADKKADKGGDKKAEKKK